MLKNVSRVSVSGSTRHFRVPFCLLVLIYLINQDLEQFKGKLNPFSHKQLKTILKSEGGDGGRSIHTSFFLLNSPPN